MQIHYYGHSSLGLEINGKHILVDPFISGNPKAAAIDIQQLKADYVLLTHAHYDHVWDVEAIVERTKATIISNHEIVTYYNNQKKYEGHAMNQGGSWNFDFGRVTAVNAIHSSSFPDGTYGGNPLGFIIEAEGKTIYISGDTDVTMDMKLIPMFHKIDLAIFPIGGNFTMDAKRAIVAADFVECNRIMGMHYDTAPWIEINHSEAIQQFKEKGKELLLVDIGNAITV